MMVEQWVAWLVALMETSLVVKSVALMVDGSVFCLVELKVFQLVVSWAEKKAL